MGLSFLPECVLNAVNKLDYNLLTEIRLRRGQPVIIGYDNEYRYLGEEGVSLNEKDKIAVSDVNSVLNAATKGCIYAYTEQMKSGFITVGHGVRIGIAGEYVTQDGCVNTIKNITSLNIRIPHDIKGCSDYICKNLLSEGLKSILIFSKPGMGKTTMLRDISRYISRGKLLNVLIFDERGEIAAIDGYGDGFDIGYADVVRSFNKFDAIKSAVRAMKPDVIITDELYGEKDLKAVEYAYECGINIIASSHTVDRKVLSKMPFEYFVELKKINGQPVIYDKNFNTYSNSGVNDHNRNICFSE